jgi:type IV secretion system protein VirB6
MSFPVFEWLGDAIENAINQVVLESVVGIIDLLTPIIVSLVSIHLAYKSYNALFGHLDVREWGLHFLIVPVATGLALNLEALNYYVFGLISDVESSFAGALVSDTSNSSTMAALDSFVALSFDKVAYCWDQVSIIDPSSYPWLTLAIVITLFHVAIASIAGVIIIGAKFMLAVFSILAPVFILCFIFPSARQYFFNWLNKIIENILVIVISFVVVSITLRITGVFVTFNKIDSENFQPIAALSAYLIMGFAIYYIIKSIPNMAGGLSSTYGNQLFKPPMPKIGGDRPPAPPAPTNHITQGSSPSGGNSPGSSGNSGVRYQPSYSSPVADAINRHNG